MNNHVKSVEKIRGVARRIRGDKVRFHNRIPF